MIHSVQQEMICKVQSSAVLNTKINIQQLPYLYLLSGIGYFTLPYLVHARAAHVHACEWNPAAVAALQRNLEVNGVSDRCTVHPGDNRQVKSNLHQIFIPFFLFVFLHEICLPAADKMFLTLVKENLLVIFTELIIFKF